MLACQRAGICSRGRQAHCLARRLRRCSVRSQISPESTGGAPIRPRAQMDTASAHGAGGWQVRVLPESSGRWSPVSALTARILSWPGLGSLQAAMAGWQVMRVTDAPSFLCSRWFAKSSSPGHAALRHMMLVQSMAAQLARARGQ